MAAVKTIRSQLNLTILTFMIAASSLCWAQKKISEQPTTLKGVITHIEDSRDLDGALSLVINATGKNISFGLVAGEMCEGKPEYLGMEKGDTVEIHAFPAGSEPHSAWDACSRKGLYIRYLSQYNSESLLKAYKSGELSYENTMKEVMKAQLASRALLEEIRKKGHTVYAYFAAPLSPRDIIEALDLLHLPPVDFPKGIKRIDHLGYLSQNWKTAGYGEKEANILLDSMTPQEINEGKVWLSEIVPKAIFDKRLIALGLKVDLKKECRKLFDPLNKFSAEVRSKLYYSCKSNGEATPDPLNDPAMDRSTEQHYESAFALHATWDPVRAKKIEAATPKSQEITARGSLSDFTRDKKGLFAVLETQEYGHLTVLDSKSNSKARPLCSNVPKSLPDGTKVEAHGYLDAMRRILYVCGKKSYYLVPF